MDARCTAPPAPGEQVHRRVFRGERAELAAVRRFAGEVLPPDCPVLADFVLMLDEVAANAVLHTDSGLPGGSFEVAIRYQAGLARGEVRDAGARTEPNLLQPALSPAAGQAMAGAPGLSGPPGLPGLLDWSGESGRGLFIVSMLAKQWGSHRLGAGRVVWFETADSPCTT